MDPKTISPTIPKVTPDPEHITTPFTLTDLQCAYHLAEGNLFPLGNMSSHLVFELEWPDFDLARFCQAWQQLIERHHSLRAVINADHCWQILASVEKVSPQIVDCSQMTAAEQASRSAQIRQQLIETGPATNRWPLFEIVVIKLPASKIIMYLSICLVVVDGRSITILMKELVELYLNPQASLTPLSCSVRDIIVGLEKLRASQPYLDCEKYWLDRMATLPGPPELPTVKDIHKVEKSLLSYFRTSIPIEQWRNIEQFALENNIVPSVVVYTVFAKILAVWSSSEQFCVSMLHFNCPLIHKDIMKIVSNFSSTSLLETNIPVTQSLVEIAHNIQSQFQQDLSFSLFNGVQVLQERSRRNKSVGASMPIAFVSMKNLFSIDTQSLFQIKDGYVQTTHVYLDCGVVEETQGLLIKWAVLAEVFPPNMIADMLEAMRLLLVELATDKTKWQQPLTVQSNARQMAARNKVNADVMPLSHKLLHELFADQVKITPQQPAIITGKVTLSYQDLFQLSNQIAHQLIKDNVSVNSLVAVVMEKGWEQVPAILGILNAGAAYVPIDASFPQQRIDKLLAVTKATVVLTQSQIISKFTWPTSVKRYVVELNSSTFKEQSSEPVAIRQTPKDLAYVIFTSGSTGEPKGVAIEHEGAVNTVLDINRRFNVNSQDKILAISELNFDLSVYDIFGSLAVGATVVIPETQETRDPSKIAKYVAEQGVTIWNSVPAFVQMFQEYIQDQALDRYRSLRLIMMSGDWIPLNLAKQLKKIFPKVAIISLGGATECSIWSILYPIETIDPAWKSIPYGKPMINQTFHILDGQLNDCPDYVKGDIYIGGVGLAREYWQAPTLTEKSFIIHPKTKQRLYRTGDLGRYLADGNIEFLGRADSQIKIQGFRVELGEIEAVLQSIAAIKEMVVTARELTAGEKQLVAYLVLHDKNSNQEALYQDIQTQLKAKLPIYMVPKHIIFLPALPLTANGKVDRKQLPLPNQIISSAGQQHIVPRDETERSIADIWLTILNLQDRKISVTDNFFDLGGHSISAVRLMSQLKKVFQKDLPLALLYEHSTIEKLALLIKSSAELPKVSCLVPFKESGHKPPLFCIHAVGGHVLSYQELADNLSPAQPFYGIQALSLEGSTTPLDTIEKMAAYYLSQIKLKQPTGPYYISGWSFGGIVAYEIAQQLQRQQEAVASLILLDSWAPFYIHETATDDDQLLKLFSYDLQGRQGSQVLEIALPLCSSKGLDTSLAELHKQLLQHNLIPAEMELTQLKMLFLTYKINMLAMINYKPQPSAITVNLLRAQDPPPKSFNDHLMLGEHALGWDKLARVNVRHIPGDHYSMFRAPNAKVLVKNIEQCLEP